MRWRREPFRPFFPLGVLLGWIGIGHWLLYSTGVTATYSCMLHGLVQTQAFLMAFAVGFLMTAVPRRTQAPPPTSVELGIAAGALVVTAVAAAAESWVAAQVAYVVVLAVLLQFAVRRFVGRAPGRRPPAAFVLIPFGFLHGLVGAGAIVAWASFDAPGWAAALGRLFVEQGVFLCLVVGVGALVLPLMAGAPPPPDLGSAPRERLKASAYAVAGAVIFASLVAEQAGWSRLAPLVRGLVVAGALAMTGAWRPPVRPGLHRRLVWTAVWLVPTGLVTSAAWPDYRVPALHLLFIGGFSLLAFGVATHVALSHLDGMERERESSPIAVRILGLGILLAMMGRFAADWSATYFAHLGAAAASWLVGSAAWLAYLGPRLLTRDDHDS